MQKVKDHDKMHQNMESSHFSLSGFYFVAFTRVAKAYSIRAYKTFTNMISDLLMGARHLGSMKLQHNNFLPMALYKISIMELSYFSYCKVEKNGKR